MHISKLGRGKRIDRVEDVVNLGDELEVRVDDIDQNGKLSLTLVGDDAGPTNGADGPERSAPRAASAPSGGGADGLETVSFEREWDAQTTDEFGDLGPAVESTSGGGGGERSGGGRPPRRRGGGGSRRR